jgi:hypothetical protein
MKKLSLIPVLILSAAAALPAAAAPGREVITAEQIAAALNTAGMRISPQQVELLSNVVATTPAPMLEVKSMERTGDHRTMVRLDCADPGQCLPFFVAVRSSPTNGPLLALADSDPSSAAIPAMRPRPGAFTVRAGSPATLLLDSNRVHIRLSVICLENGAAGQTIRVTSKDHRQVYNAEVVDAALLRGQL